VSTALTHSAPFPIPPLMIWERPARIREPRAVTGIGRNDLIRNFVAAMAAAPVLAGVAATDPVTPQAPYFRLVSEGTSDPFVLMLIEDATTPAAVSFAGYERYNQANWDGYGAEPITPETLRYARRLMPVIPDTFGRPDVAPSGDGAIGLEWVLERGRVRKLFLDIGPGSVWRASWTLRNGEFGRAFGTGFTSATCEQLDELFGQLCGLRHVLASVAASSGMGSPIIGKMLGHTQASTTHRYTHLASA
jgi:hypothetical protein